MKKNVFLLLPLLLISSCSLKNNYDYINEEFDNGKLFTLSEDEDMVVDGIEDNNYKNLEVISSFNDSITFAGFPLESICSWSIYFSSVGKAF